MRKNAKRILISLILVVLLIAIIGNYLAKAVLSEVSDSINARENNGFIVQYEKSRYNLFTNTFSIFGLRIHPSEESTKKIPFAVNLDKISIQGLDIRELINEKFEVGRVKIVKPDLKYYIQRDSATDTLGESSNLSYELIWNQLEIVSGSVVVYEINADTTLRDQLYGISLTLGKEKLSSTENPLSKQEVEIKNFQFDLNNLQKVKMGHLSYVPSLKRLKLKKVFVGADMGHHKFFKNIEFKKNWYNITMDSLVIAGFDPSQSVTNNSVEKISVYSPDFFIKSMEGIPENEDAEKLDIREVISSKFNPQNIEIFNGKLRFRNYFPRSSKYREFRIDRFSVRLNDFYLNKEDFWKSGYFRCEEIFINLSEKEKLHIGEVTSDLSKNEVKAKNLRIEHENRPDQYLKNQLFSRAWLNFESDSLLVKKIDVKDVVLNQQIECSGLDFYGLKGFVKERGDLPKDPKKKALLMHDWFRAIPWNHDIRNICFVDGSLNYELYLENVHSRGSFEINDISACIDRITNIDSNAITNVNARGLFNGVQPVFLEVDLPVYSNYEYTLSGGLKNINLPDLNSFVNPMKIEFLKGRMHLLEFTFHSKGIKAKSKGEVFFHYNDLEVIALKDVMVVTDKKRLFNRREVVGEEENWFLSMAINVLAKEENLPGKKGYVVGIIDKEREMNIGFFGHMVRCLSQGAEYCLLKKRNKTKRKRI